MPSNNEHWEHLERRRSELSRHRENSTRPARCWATYKTTGVGKFIEEKVFRFNTSFIDMPVMHFGAVYINDENSPDFPVEDPPVCFAGGYDWEINSAGYYTGAFCYFSVDTSVYDDYQFLFTLSWEAVASKHFIASKGFPVNDLDI